MEPRTDALVDARVSSAVYAGSGNLLKFESEAIFSICYEGRQLSAGFTCTLKWNLDAHLHLLRLLGICQLGRRPGIGTQYRVDLLGDLSGGSITTCEYLLFRYESRGVFFHLTD